MINRSVRISSVLSATACVCLILTAGHPIIRIIAPNELLWPILVGIFGGALILTNGTVSRNSVVVLLFFVILSAVHLVFYGTASANSSLGFIFMIGWSLIAVNLIRPFSEWYIQIMSVVATISLVFYSLNLIGAITPEMFSWLPGANVTEGGVHAWLYYFHHSGNPMRSSGPFWEPGAFAGYLELALIFVLMQRGQKLTWKPIVLVLATLTTMSTAGYAGLAVIGGIWFIDKNRGHWTFYRLAMSTVGILCFVTISLYALENLPFLGNKIVRQVENVQMARGYYEINRFGSLLYDLPFILERPLIGWTPANTFRNEVDPLYETVMTGHGNGLSGFTSRFGVTALLFYLWCVFCVARRFSMTRSQGGLMIVWVSVILFGEQYLVYPVFWCFIMVSRRQAVKSGRVVA